MCVLHLIWYRFIFAVKQLCLLLFEWVPSFQFALQQICDHKGCES